MNVNRRLIAIARDLGELYAVRANKQTSLETYTARLANINPELTPSAHTAMWNCTPG